VRRVRKLKVKALEKRSTLRPFGDPLFKIN
jgi:hypothetical protein